MGGAVTVGGAATVSAAQPKLKSILFASDFSSASEAAFLHAAAIARRLGSRLYLAHALGPEVYALTPPEHVEAAVQAAREDAKGKLEALARSPELHDIPHESLQGDASEEEVVASLLRMIRSRQIDLVVAGTHGRHGVRRFLMGSTAEGLFRRAPCPVMTVGPHVSKEATPFRCILLPTSLSEKRQFVATYAFSLASAYSARLTLLHVVTDATAGATGLHESALAGERKRQMERLVAGLRTPRQGLDLRLEFGDAAQWILHVASEEKADLIVMGVRNTDPLTAHVEADVAYAVAASSRCPVVTVHALA